MLDFRSTKDTKMPQRTLRNVVIDYVMAEFVVFIVVLRELRGLVSIFFILIVNLKYANVGLGNKFKEKI